MIFGMITRDIGLWLLLVDEQRVRTKKAIRSLRSDKVVFVTSTRGKLQVLKKHYKALGIG